MDVYVNYCGVELNVEDTYGEFSVGDPRCICLLDCRHCSAALYKSAVYKEVFGVFIGAYKVGLADISRNANAVSIRSVNGAHSLCGLLAEYGVDRVYQLSRALRDKSYLSVHHVFDRYRGA